MKPVPGHQRIKPDYRCQDAPEHPLRTAAGRIVEINRGVLQYANPTLHELYRVCNDRFPLPDAALDSLYLQAVFSVVKSQRRFVVFERIDVSDDISFREPHVVDDAILADQLPHHPVEPVPGDSLMQMYIRDRPVGQIDRRIQLPADIGIDVADRKGEAVPFVHEVRPEYESGIAITEQGSHTEQQYSRNDKHQAMEPLTGKTGISGDGMRKGVVSYPSHQVTFVTTSFPEVNNRKCAVSSIS